MVRYRFADETDMDEIASVHVLTQPEYFTTTLGKDLLSKFYREFLLEDNLFIVAFDDIADKIVGFCMGNWYGSKAEKRWESKYHSQIIKRLFANCLQLNILAITRVFRRIKDLALKPIMKNAKEDIYYSHLLSLGVLPEYRGQHIASTMIDIFEEKCLQTPPVELQNVEKVCTIGAYKWNTAGCKLYFSKGYRIYSENGKKVKFRKTLNSEKN